MIFPVDVTTKLSLYIRRAHKYVSERNHAMFHLEERPSEGERVWRIINVIFENILIWRYRGAVSVATPRRITWEINYNDDPSRTESHDGGKVTRKRQENDEMAIKEWVFS